MANEQITDQDPIDAVALGDLFAAANIILRNLTIVMIRL